VRYAIIIEKGKRNCSAYVPDVPGCVAAAKTVDEVKKLMKEALEFHFEGMTLDNEPIPKATSECAYVNIDTNKLTKTVRQQRRASSA
jgi:predicted RNase H-like HicB family nuclease